VSAPTQRARLMSGADTAGKADERCRHSGQGPAVASLQ